MCMAPSVHLCHAKEEQKSCPDQSLAEIAEEAEGNKKKKGEKKVGLIACLG